MFGRIGKFLVTLAMILGCSVAAVARPIPGEGDIVFGWSGYLKCSKGGPLSGTLRFVRTGGIWAGYIDVSWVKHSGNGGSHRTLLFSLKPKTADKPVDDTKALIPVPLKWVDTPTDPVPVFTLADVTYGREKSFVDITLRSTSWSCDEQTWEQTGGHIFDVEAQHIRQLSEKAAIAAARPAAKTEGSLTGSDLFALFLRSILNSKSSPSMEAEREWAAKEEKKQRRRQEELNCKLAKIAANNPNHLECYDFRPD